MVFCMYTYIIYIYICLFIYNICNITNKGPKEMSYASQYYSRRAISLPVSQKHANGNVRRHEKVKKPQGDPAPGGLHALSGSLRHTVSFGSMSVDGYSANPECLLRNNDKTTTGSTRTQQAKIISEERRRKMLRIKSTHFRTPPATASPSVSPGASPVDDKEIIGKGTQTATSIQEQIENLIYLQKENEVALATLLRLFLLQLPHNVVDTQVVLQQALHDRNKALNLLEKMQLEGNAVVCRLHQNLKQQQERIARLTRENAQLRGKANPDVFNDNKDRTEHCDAGISGSNNNNNNNDDGDGDGDHNDYSTTRVVNSGDAARISQLFGTISELKAVLRHEKEERLKAEEMFHKIVLEHQRSISLLEERLLRSSSSQNMAHSATEQTQNSDFGKLREDTVFSCYLPATTNESTTLNNDSFTELQNTTVVAEADAKITSLIDSAKQESPAPYVTTPNGQNIIDNEPQIL